MNVTLLKSEECIFKESEGKFLDLAVNGKTYEDVKVYRSFPFSYPDKYICVMDHKGKEIGVIEELSEFNENVRRMIENALDARYFTPEIIEVNDVREEFAYFYWDVVTTAGPKCFTVQGGKGDLKMLGNGSILVVDVDGNRYLIKELSIFKEKHIKMIDSITN